MNAHKIRKPRTLVAVGLSVATLVAVSLAAGIAGAATAKGDDLSKSIVTSAAEKVVETPKAKTEPKPLVASPAPETPVAEPTPVAPAPEPAPAPVPVVIEAPAPPAFVAPPVKCPAGTTPGAIDGAGNESACAAPCSEWSDPDGAGPAPAVCTRP